MSPLASVSAALHSIIPAPVASRSFFTNAALISVITLELPEAASSQLPAPSYETQSGKREAGSWKLYKKTPAHVQAGDVYSKPWVRPTPGTGTDRVGIDGPPGRDAHGRLPRP